MTGTLERRAFLAGAALVPVGLAAATLPFAGGSGLDAVAQSRGLRFGMMSVKESLDDPVCADVIRRECGLTGPCNALKWHRTNPTGPMADYAEGDRHIAFAEASGLAARGHCIVWDKPGLVPGWVTGKSGRGASQLAHVVANRAHEIVSHYRGRIGCWDVVNEAIRPNSGRPVGGPLYRRLGWDFAEVAFLAAHEADPDARLFYTDFVLPDRPAHQRGVLGLLERFLARGIPVHGLGIQSHLWSDPGPAAFADWQSFLAEVAAMGLDIHLTELDVIDNHLPGDIALRDRLAGDRMRRYLDVTLAEPAVREIRTWSVSDRYEGVSGLNPRSDGLKRRPSPFDEAMQPKPICHAIRAALLAAPMH